MVKAGLFGGTFNPVHNGHLRTALEVREGFGLETIHFIPSANPPHKGNSGLADAPHRVRMLSLAIEGMPGFRLSDIELRRPGRSYTIDTVDEMAAGQSAVKYFLIVGLDAFLEIDTWKSFKALFERIDLIVMSRPPDGGGLSENPFDTLGHFVRQRLSNRYAFDCRHNRFTHPEWHPIHLFTVTPLGISATRIRTLIRGGGSIRYLVPDRVADYIDKEGLYTW